MELLSNKIFLIYGADSLDTIWIYSYIRISPLRLTLLIWDVRQLMSTPGRFAVANNMKSSDDQ